MSTLAQLAQDVLDNYDELTSLDGGATARLAQVTDFGTEVLLEVAQHAQWDFLTASANVLFTAGLNYAVLPTDYLSMPYSGALLKVDRSQMVPVSMRELLVYRYEYTGDPLYYAITARIETTTILTTENRVLVYTKTPTETTDFPSAFHNSVIYQGMIAKALQSKGEGGPYWEKYRRNLDEMVRRNRPQKHRVFHLPLARGGMC